MRYPPTITQNVRDVADVEKRHGTARQGPTTIRAGEPGMVLRSADGKSELGRLGTMPDGSMSLAVHVSGAVQDIRNPIREAGERITYLDQERVKMDKRVTDNRSSITFLDTERGKHQATLDNHEGRISDNRASITYLDNNKASNGALAVERGRIDGLDRTKANQSALNVESGRISTVDRKADSAQSTANSAYSRAGDALANAASAASQASSNASAIAGLRNGLQNALERIAALEYKTRNMPLN